MGQYHSDSKPQYDMAKTVAVLSYFTPLGWLVAVVLHGDHKSSFASFHLRQSLGLTITSALLFLIPLIGWLLTLGIIFAWFCGAYSALNGRQHLVPFVGQIYQDHLDFIS